MSWKEVSTKRTCRPYCLLMRARESTRNCLTFIVADGVAVSEQEEDFATMFEASVVKARRVEQGQTIEGTIVALGSEVALVSIGGKSEAQIDVAELKEIGRSIEGRPILEAASATIPGTRSALSAATARARRRC